MMMGNLAACLDSSLREAEDCCEVSANVDVPTATDPAKLEARKSRREMVILIFLASKLKGKDYLYHRSRWRREAARLRSGSHLVPAAIGAETKETRNVAHANQRVILRYHYPPHVVLTSHR